MSLPSEIRLPEMYRNEKLEKRSFQFAFRVATGLVLYPRPIFAFRPSQTIRWVELGHPLFIPTRILLILISWVNMFHHFLGYIKAALGLKIRPMWWAQLADGYENMDGAYWRSLEAAEEKATSAISMLCKFLKSEKGSCFDGTPAKRAWLIISHQSVNAIGTCSVRARFDE